MLTIDPPVFRSIIPAAITWIRFMDASRLQFIVLDLTHPQSLKSQMSYVDQIHRLITVYVY
jgi:predicted 2-oxoglutarate/Fe(II)-dependent dioxygenase YbiX